MTGDRRAQLLGAGLAALWLVAILVVDLATRQSMFVPAVLYALAPLIACAVLRPLPTAGFGLVVIALSIASGLWDHTWGTWQMWLRVIDVTLVSAAAVALATVRVRRERQFARVERIAEIAQRAVLPVLPTRVGTVAASARYVSAAEDALVGGDLYDWFHSNRRICFVVGDVRGKGIGAVEQAARVIRAFRQSAAGDGELATATAQMSAYLAPFLDDEEFVTASLLQVNGPECVTLVSCGHPRPLLVARGGDARLLDLPACLPLGLGTVYESTTIPWALGDRLLLYTDGLSEARDERGEYLPVLPLASLLRTENVEDALDNVLLRVRQHVPGGRFTDDLALMLLENSEGDDPFTVDPRDSLGVGTEPLPPRPDVQTPTEGQAGLRLTTWLAVRPLVLLSWCCAHGIWWVTTSATSP